PVGRVWAPAFAACAVVASAAAIARIRAEGEWRTTGADISGMMSSPWASGVCWAGTLHPGRLDVAPVGQPVRLGGAADEAGVCTVSTRGVGRRRPESTCARATADARTASTP